MTSKPSGYTSSTPTPTPLAPGETLPKASPPTSASFPLLVAVAADECTAASVRIAEVLAVERKATPTLLYVMEVLPIATADGSIGTDVLIQTLLEPQAQERDKRALRAVCHADAGVPATWPMDIDVGDPGLSIVTRARQMNAQLIIMGVRPHTAAGRVFGRDTMHNVMRLAGIPVLAVRPELNGRPRSIVVAIDFSRASIRAAHMARRLLADDGRMSLVFVASSPEQAANESQEGQRLIESRGVEMAFSQLRRMLEPGPGMTIVSMTRRGDPVTELKAVCEEIGPDLVVIGSQRHPFLDRLVLGSVAASIAKDGRWSVLVMPPLHS